MTSTGLDVDLTGKVALVTGASRGIGKAVALTFAANGASVVLASRTREQLDEVATEITAAGGTAHVIAVDTSSPAENERLFAEAEAAMGPVSILVNNAGGGGTYVEGGSETLLNTDAAAARTIFDLNVIGPTVLARAAAHSMKERGGGAILNMSSRLAQSPNPAVGIYCASKAAVQSLTTSWAMELGQYGIRVNALAPGGVATANMGRIMEDDQLRSKYEATVPLGTLGAPADAADCALFLVSDAARWISGATLLVTGGRP